MEVHAAMSEERKSLPEARKQPTSDDYMRALRRDLERAYDALGGLQRDVERECGKVRPSKQRLREALHRSDLGRDDR